jgi:diguanylate cyclase (GGDEF)-like protein/PAS domain S-box-containing protein
MKFNSTMTGQPSRPTRDIGLEILTVNYLTPSKMRLNSQWQKSIVLQAYNWIRFWQRRSRRGWHFGHWIALLSIGGTSVAASGAAYLSYNTARRLILQQGQENVQLKVQQSAREIDRLLAERQKNLAAIAKNRELRQSLAAIVNRLRYGSGSYAFLLNERGIPLISSQEDTARGAIASPNQWQPKMVWEGLKQIQLQGQRYYLARNSLQQANGAIALIVPAENLKSPLGGLNLLAVVAGGLLFAASIAELGLVRASLAARASAAQERLLNRLTERIRASLDLEEILQTTVEEVAKLLDVERVAFCQYDPQQGTLQNWWEYSRKPQSRSLQVELEWENQAEQNPGPRAKQCFFVPVPGSSESPGYLILSQAAPWFPTAAEKELLETVANQLAIAITQSRLYSQTQQQVQRFAHALEQAALVVITDEEGRITRINDRFCQLFQYNREELIGQHYRLLQFCRPSTQLLRELYSTLARKQVWKGEVNLMTKAGVNYWLDTTIFPFVSNSGIPPQYLAVGFDISPRKQAEARLRHNAYHDELTGLLNRTALMEHLERAIAQSQQPRGYPFALLFLDLDRFKAINDSLGHPIGDRLLAEISRRLETCLRPTDIIARFGGDEFIILLKGIRREEEAVRVAACIQNSLQIPLNLSGYEVFTTTSIGIALSAARYQQPEEVLRDANIAMYRAKAQNPGGYVVFDREMHARAIDLMQMECDLRRAVDTPSEFHLYYQPIVALNTGRIVGFEVLVRWQHPERGCILPGTFIPVAEETQLIVPLGEWVLLEAGRQLRLWQDQFSPSLPLTLSVNFSGVQLVQADLMERIDRILGAIALTGQGLKIEITESVMMTNLEAVKAWLKHLQSRQIQVSIDDFGTGYSSLSYLSSLPINTLKIDRSFIKRMTRARENLQIVQAIISLAHNLGMDVIAEGVETEFQQQQLQALGCDCGQGYYFSQPLSCEEATALLAQQLGEVG